MLMHTTSLYLTCVLIWGSTWFAIKFQLGEVAAEVSLVYRFSLAAVLLLLYCLLSKRNLRFFAITTFVYRITGTVSIFHQLSDFLLGYRAFDLRHRRAIIFHGDIDEYRQWSHFFCAIRLND